MQLLPAAMGDTDKGASRAAQVPHWEHAISSGHVCSSSDLHNTAHYDVCIVYVYVACTYEVCVYSKEKSMIYIHIQAQAA